MQLLRTILIIVIIYYLAKLFSRYVLPLLAKYLMRQTHKKNQKQAESSRGKVGEMHVKYKPKKKNELDDLGEYVDYEEIKDTNKNSQS